MGDLISAWAERLTPPLPPAPAGMHWQPTVSRDDVGDQVQFNAVWRLVPTITFEDDPDYAREVDDDRREHQDRDEGVRG